MTEPQPSPDSQTQPSSSALATTGSGLVDYPRVGSSPIVEAAKHSAYARMAKATAERLVKASQFGREALTPVEIETLIQMHIYYGLESSQDHITVLGGKAYFTANAYLYKAHQQEDFVGLDYIRLDRLADAIMTMQGPLQTAYIQQLNSISLTLVAEAFVPRIEGEVVYAALAKKSMAGIDRLFIGIGRATKENVKLPEVRDNFLEEMAQTRAVRRALSRGWSFSFVGSEEDGIALKNFAECMAASESQHQASNVSRLPAGAMKRNAPGAANDDPVIKFRGNKRASELDTKDLSGVIVYLEQAIANPDKAQYKTGNQKLLASCTAEYERRLASERDAAAAEIKPTEPHKTGADAKSSPQASHGCTDGNLFDD